MSKLTEPTTESKIELVGEEIIEKTKSELEILYEEVDKIIKEYELESNIPMSHAYWSLMNRIRGLKK